MEQQIGRDGQFRSPRQWSLAAGLNQSMVNQVMERGRADPETLIKIGHAAGKTPREMFILAGWLEEEPTELTAEEETLLADYRRLRDEPALRAVGLGVFRTILEQLRNQGQNPESV